MGGGVRVMGMLGLIELSRNRERSLFCQRRFPQALVCRSVVGARHVTVYPPVAQTSSVPTQLIHPHSVCWTQSIGVSNCTSDEDLNVNNSTRWRNECGWRRSDSSHIIEPVL